MPATPAATTTTPAATSVPSQAAPTATAPGVPLSEAAQKVSDMISMGARNGISQARIQLSPESLGSIQIRLQQTSDGLVAHVVTEHPEAAKLLAQNGEDLRRSLQQNGSTLLRLDIESSDQRRSSAQQQAAASFTGSGRPGGTDDDPEEDAADPVASVTEIPTYGLSSSALVNVLA
jgi:flagellar hook-length control protein FliK